MTTSIGPHLFWITSRAAGIVALVLASVAVALGLLMSTRLVRSRRPDFLAAHEVVSLATLAAIAVHGLTLLGDSYLHASLLDLAVPLASAYRTFWTSLGIVAGWGLALLGLGYYARGLIGARRWRSLHRLTVLLWLAGLVHALGEGSDAGQGWLIAMLAIVAVPALALALVRLGRSSRPIAGPGRANRGAAAFPGMAGAAGAPGAAGRRPDPRRVAFGSVPPLQARRVADHEA